VDHISALGGGRAHGCFVGSLLSFPTDLSAISVTLGVVIHLSVMIHIATEWDERDNRSVRGVTRETFEPFYCFCFSVGLFNVSTSCLLWRCSIILFSRKKRKASSIPLSSSYISPSPLLSHSPFGPLHHHRPIPAFSEELLNWGRQSKYSYHQYPKNAVSFNHSAFTINMYSPTRHFSQEINANTLTDHSVYFSEAIIQNSYYPPTNKKAVHLQEAMSLG